MKTKRPQTKAERSLLKENAQLKRFANHLADRLGGLSQVLTAWLNRTGMPDAADVDQLGRALRGERHDPDAVRRCLVALRTRANEAAEARQIIAAQG